MIALLIAAGVSLLVSLMGTPFLISRLRARGVGQPIQEELVGHFNMAGTPTMGGIAIVGGAGIGYLVAHVRGGVVFTWAGLLAMLAIAGAGLVGLVDDWIKLKYARNVGLSRRAKAIGLLVVAVVFAVLAQAQANVSTNLAFTRPLDLDLGPWLWAGWAVLLFYGATSAVKLTDGPDGLAAGSGTFSFASYVVIGFWAFRHQGVYDIPQGLDLAVVAASMVGGSLGFLWWNAAPARLIMGDTGALALGAGLAALALLTNTHLLLPLIGGIYVVESASVVIQVAYFKLSRRRVLRMAPIHHHFELVGWPETTVTIRFWILAGLSAAIALGVFYADYLSIPGVID